MAGEWIRYRQELETHPRFLSLCTRLIYGDSAEPFLAYACGEVALIEGLPGTGRSVTERALCGVTADALRAVILRSTLRVWCAVNSHCLVDSMDAIMRPMILADLDDIAGFTGFGEAFLAVGWVEAFGRNSLRFKNFLEFNEPACLRPKAKTNAQRQHEWRSRQTGGRATVTRVTKRNEREEKRREENIDTTVVVSTPLPPKWPPGTLEAIYQAYPRHVGKGAALPAIGKALTRLARRGEPDPVAWLTQRVQAFAKQRAGEDPNFTPHPSTWFNQGRFDDEPEQQFTVRGHRNGIGKVKAPAGTDYDAIAKLRAQKVLAADGHDDVPRDAGQGSLLLES